MAFVTIGDLKRLATILAGQGKDAVVITGGTIDGVTIGGTTPPSATFDSVTMTDIIKLETANFTAAGTNQATATALTAQVANVSGADGTAGVLLPSSPLAKFYIVYNNVATNGLNVYPSGTNTINGGSASAAVKIEGKTMAIFVGASTTNWGAIFTADT